MWAGSGHFTHLAETQRVEHRDRARADREDVAQYSPHARRRSLEWLDRARVVVRLDLERTHHSAAHVDRARVLAGTHHHVPPSVGSVRSSFFECLYAQCSLHSSEYIASST